MWRFMIVYIHSIHRNVTLKLVTLTTVKACDIDHFYRNQCLLKILVLSPGTLYIFNFRIQNVIFFIHWLCSFWRNILIFWKVEAHSLVKKSRCVYILKFVQQVLNNIYMLDKYDIYCTKCKKYADTVQHILFVEN